MIGKVQWHCPHRREPRTFIGVAPSDDLHSRRASAAAAMAGLARCGDLHRVHRGCGPAYPSPSGRSPVQGPDRRDFRLHPSVEDPDRTDIRLGRARAPDRAMSDGAKSETFGRRIGRRVRTVPANGIDATTDSWGGPPPRTAMTAWIPQPDPGH
jgi:hypothetical protein